MDSKGLCRDCLQWQKTSPGVLDGNKSVYAYNAFAKDFVARWKYRGDYVLLEALQEEIQKGLTGDREKQAVYVPLSEEREKERGFNQSKAIIQAAGLQPVSLFQRKHSEKQSKRKKRDRMEAENPFTLIETSPDPVLIVDDIYTTGRTVRHMASLLKAGGCPSVSSFTIFR
ncbi:ComF family protein [Halobacillus litoralis]|uniref:ComF family protein n=1 Tax=Halobacillus litoralis TaxID=45668 RepID=UPI001CFDE765|nr:phosphoribosyltransferase family protein [Halobacillus litoralis]